MSSKVSQTGEILVSVKINGQPVLRDKVPFGSVTQCSGCKIHGLRSYWIYCDRKGYRGPFHSSDCYGAFCQRMLQSPERLREAIRADREREKARKKSAIEARRAGERRSTPRTTVPSTRSMHQRRTAAQRVKA